MDYAEVIETLKDTIRQQREDAIKKDEVNNRLLIEITELRKKLDELTEIIQYQAAKINNPTVDSVGEEAISASGSDAPQDAMDTYVANQEQEDSKDQFQTIQTRQENRKEKRRRKFAQSSDEEQAEPPKKTNLKPDNTNAPAGKSMLNHRQLTREDFPPLPTPTPGNTITPPAASTTPPAAPTIAPKIVPRPVRTKSIPPIVITNAGKFVSISSLFRTNNIKYSSAIVVRNGIKIFPCSQEDYRKATQLLDQNKEPFYTFRFPEEKSNHVVLRGIPEHLTDEEILDDLKDQGFHPKKVIRWRHTNGWPMKLVLVLLPKSETDIFKLQVIRTFEVRVESQKSKSRGIQCYNCQDHGHAAPCCHIPAKCVKCGENHHTSQCTKPKEVPPKCANCAGDHPASFSGCPRHPSQIRSQKQSSFKGWGTQDNSRLSPKKTQKQAPKPASSNESLLSHAQLAQIAKMFAEQMKTLMTQTITNART